VFTLSFSPYFKRRAARFRRQHPEFARQLARVIRDLEENPYRRRLKLHALHGQFTGQHAVTVTYSYRIRLLMIITEHEIELLDIGTHDEVYR
jgi:addiction module RelE/StbE family toxin